MYSHYTQSCIFLYFWTPGTFKHRHHVRDKLLITFVWSPSGKYALQGSLLCKFKADYHNFKYSVLDINYKNKTTFSRLISLFFMVVWNKEWDVKALVLLSKTLFQIRGARDDIANLVIFKLKLVLKSIRYLAIFNFKHEI